MKQTQNHEQTRNAKTDDYCFLTEKEPMWGEMLADVLEQEGIPYIIQRALGSGLADRVGPILERYCFYVPSSRLEEARETAAGLFSENAES